MGSEGVTAGFQKSSNWLANEASAAVLAGDDRCGRDVAGRPARRASIVVLAILAILAILDRLPADPALVLVRTSLRLVRPTLGYLAGCCRYDSALKITFSN